VVVDGFFPTLLSTNGLPDAGAGGTVVEHDGCIWLTRRGDSDMLVLWPSGWGLMRAADQKLMIVDEQGTPVIRLGEHVTLHGGGFYYEPAYIERITGQPLPRQCEAEDYFLTSGQLLFSDE
jgi:hypothetical protein